MPPNKRIEQIVLPNTCILCLFLHKHLFLWRKINNVAPARGTWLRTHYWGIKRRKSPAPGGNGTHELKSLASQVCALPLCNNRCSYIEQYYSLPSRDVFVSSDQEVEGLQLPELGQVTGQAQGHQKTAFLRLKGKWTNGLDWAFANLQVAT